MVVRFVLLALCALALPGCGGSSGDVTTAQPPPPAQASSPQPVEAGPAAKRGLKLVKVGSFDTPVYATSPPADTRRLFVVEQAGRVMVVRGGKKLAQPFLDIRSLVTAGGEQGLLSVAFPPDYADSGRFYVYYTAKSGNQKIVEYRRASEDRANAGSARLVLEMADEEGNHNGGLLLFGPDGLMYVGTGDGGGGGDEHGRRGNAQNLGSLLGKLLRIDPVANGKAYAIPASNPFVGRSGARGEIYSYGLRNPWRFSFDRRTGDLVIGDVGQNAVEEIDFVRKGKGAGANFGWRPFEGRSRYKQGETAAGHVPPVIERSHSDGWCSITGGVVGRDSALAGLAGRYVFGDYCKGQIFSARLAAPRATDVRNTGLKVSGLASFGEDARGRIYVVSNNGPVYRFAAR
jgi:glucose/arabinose dehydrogenase